jgi:hypothetical protein
MSESYKRKHQWTISSTGREERKHMQKAEKLREEKSLEKEITKGR